MKYQPTQAQKQAAHNLYGPGPVANAAAQLYTGDATITVAPYTADGGMRGQLTDRNAILQFVKAGNATLTVVSKATGTRFTFQFQQPKHPTPGRTAPTFCKVLVGPDNKSNYIYVGTMWPESTPAPNEAQVYRHDSKSRIGKDAPSVKALIWFITSALHPSSPLALEKCEVWHEGRCGRCGAKLTVPASVSQGYGPECIGKLS